MIDHVSIQNFAIIDNVEVDFHQGLSIITGETGSGKSILVTAISLALGSRADSSYVRTGMDKAIIELAAAIDGESWIISREISAQGKNLCKINGRMVTLAELTEKCREIADIHGQYDNQSLLNPDNHIGIIDEYLSDEITPIKNSYSSAYSEYQDAKNKLNALLSLESENARKLDFYRYEIKEIEDADPVTGEDLKLSDRLAILKNSEKIFDKAGRASEDLSGANGALTSLGNAVNSLTDISSYSDTITKILEEINDTYYRLEELSQDMRQLLDDISFEPGEIDHVIERLNTLDNLKKKYSDGTGTIEKVLEYRDKISSEINVIENYDEEKTQLESRLQKKEEELLKVGEALTKARLKSAYNLKQNILRELADLNFATAELEIEFRPLDSPSPNGMETLEILITTNPGEPLKPLAKTSSGGELSRIMLAIKTVISDYDGIPTLIFDEIDQGISGKTAAVVGKKMREISKKHQILCITHLPQIAAAADTSYRIFKESDTSSTYTHLEELNAEAKVLEIARLLGGEEITKSAIDNATELISTMTE